MLPIYVSISIFAKEWKIKGLDSHLQQVMDDVLDWSKVTVTTHSYNKAQSYHKTTGTLSDPKYIRCDQRRAAAAATSSTSEEVYEVKTNDDKTFMLDGNFYPLKAFVPEEIYPGKLSKVFQGERREKIWGHQSIRIIRKELGGEENYHRDLKASAAKADTK